MNKTQVEFVSPSIQLKDKMQVLCRVTLEIIKRLQVMPEHGP